jgi:ATP-binding cassette subfamily A (ABC1) protein 3
MLLFNHFKGLFTKRMLSTLRMWKTYIALAILSIIVIVLLGYIVNNPSRSRAPTPTTLSMSSFAKYDSDNQFTIDSSSGLDAGFISKAEERLADEATTITKHDNLTYYLADQADQEIIKFAKIFIVGVTQLTIPRYSFCPSINTDNFPMKTMLYNPVPYHSRPLATNMLSNILLTERGSSARIQMTSLPLVYKTDLSVQGIPVPDFSVSAVQFLVIMSIAMSLLLGIFIIFPLKERVTNAKQVQLMAGVSPIVFWLTNFVWDFIIYLPIATIYCLILYLFDTRLIFHTSGGFSALVVLIVFLGLAGIPWAYLMNFAFNSAPSAYAILIISTIVIGICGPLAVIFLQ